MQSQDGNHCICNGLKLVMLDMTWNNGAVHLNKEHWRYVLGWALGGLHMPNPSLQFLCFWLVLFGSNVLDVISSATRQYSWCLQVLNYLQQYPWEQSFWDYECKQWLLVQWWFLPVPCLGAEALKNKVESVGANKLKKTWLTSVVWVYCSTSNKKYILTNCKKYDCKKNDHM